jgi:hypothetical protein
MYAIGVDDHKASSHLTVLDGTGRVVRAGRIGNTAAEVRKVVAPFGNEAEAALEATRNWTVMYDLLEAEVRAVHLVHPLKVRAIAEARVKTDRIDSGMLAHLLRCDLLPTAYGRPAQRATQQLLRQRVFFVRVRTMVKNRMHVLIDRQHGIREVATEISDLLGQAGLAWLRTVALSGPERALRPTRDLRGQGARPAPDAATPFSRAVPTAASPRRSRAPRADRHAAARRDVGNGRDEVLDYIAPDFIGQ